MVKSKRKTCLTLINIHLAFKKLGKNNKKQKSHSTMEILSQRKSNKQKQKKEKSLIKLISRELVNW